jgi:thiamine monophosphate kinase
MSLRRWVGDDDWLVDHARKRIGAILGATLDVLAHGRHFSPDEAVRERIGDRMRSQVKQWF